MIIVIETLFLVFVFALAFVIGYAAFFPPEE